jgi:hypothetical protein
MPKRFWLYWLIAIAVAWGFDLLFWGKAPGISVTLWILLVLVTGVSLNVSEGRKPSLWNIPLMVLALGSAVVPAIRSDPLTNFSALAVCFISLFLLAFSYEKAYWMFYRIQDHIKALLSLIGAMFTRPLGLHKAEAATAKPAGGSPKKTGRILFAILRGILIAIPVLGILAVLLAAADPIFSQWLVTIFNLQLLPEYLFRLIIIIILAFLLTGAWLHAGFPSRGEKKPDDGRVILKPFVGWIESSVVLFLVDVLFLSFVILQVRYLFGGQAGSGFTYSEYARRGFFELVAVAIVSMLLYLVIGTVTRRTARHEKITFTVLASLLIALVLVILASSFQRLAQYEQAYGFSRLRTYTHVFILWLAVLLVATLVLEVLRRQRWLGACLLCCVLGFAVTLASLNVDGFILQHNLGRVAHGFRYDTQYAITLSNDAVPAIISAFHDPTYNSGVRDQLGATLACRLAVMETETRPWQSFNLGDAKAYRLLTQTKPELLDYPVTVTDGIWQVSVAGHPQECFPALPIDYIPDR